MNYAGCETTTCQQNDFECSKIQVANKLESQKIEFKKGVRINLCYKKYGKQESIQVELR